jgi:hypothetical protein
LVRFGSQVRAQFAALGAPLLGDSAYAPQRGVTLDGAATDLDDPAAWLPAAQAAHAAARAASGAKAANNATAAGAGDVGALLPLPRTLAAVLTARRLEGLARMASGDDGDGDDALEAHAEAPVALQAARIVFAGRDVHCRPPWWRRETIGQLA